MGPQPVGSVRSGMSRSQSNRRRRVARSNRRASEDGCAGGARCAAVGICAGAVGDPISERRQGCARAAGGQARWRREHVGSEPAHAAACVSAALGRYSPPPPYTHTRPRRRARPPPPSHPTYRHAAHDRAACASAPHGCTCAPISLAGGPSVYSGVVCGAMDFTPGNVMADLLMPEGSTRILCTHVAATRHSGSVGTGAGVFVCMCVREACVCVGVCASVCVRARVRACASARHNPPALHSFPLQTEEPLAIAEGIIRADVPVRPSCVVLQHVRPWCILLQHSTTSCNIVQRTSLRRPPRALCADVPASPSCSISDGAHTVHHGTANHHAAAPRRAARGMPANACARERVCVHSEVGAWL